MYEEETLEDKLVSQVVKQIREDFNSQDVTALFELLYDIPADKLVNYLPEDKHEEFKIFLR
jgi:hypothetical protein